MTEAKERMDIFCRELDSLSHGLMDIYQEYGDAPVYNLSFSADKFEPTQENLDAFDWSGMQYSFSFDMIETTPQEVNWDEVCALIETTVTNGHLMEPDATEFPSMRQYGNNVLRRASTYYKGDSHDKEFMLRQLQRFEDNPGEIFSLDDSVFDKSYNLISNFEMKVPLEIHGQGEELVIKADIPDILFNSSNAEDINLQFKSVLAMLPERINTRQLKPTFVDGQFRLELPKREEQRNRQIL